MIKEIINYIKDDKFKIIYVNNSLDIINYDQLLEVKDEMVTIEKENKIIIIKGNNLRIEKLLDKELLIKGLINIIELSR